jgi:hypothetical protein
MENNSADTVRPIEGPDAKDPNRPVLQARGRALLKKVTGDGDMSAK